MAEAKLSPVETLKEQSNYLRGTIAQELQDGSDCFSKGSTQLLKHHGTYQQDNRDERAAARKAGDGGKAHSMMVRTQSARRHTDQPAAVGGTGSCATNWATRRSASTSRQALQLHGILKGNLRETIRRINEVQLTTLAACGDVERNVMGCPAPYKDPLHQQVQNLAEALSEHFRAAHAGLTTSCGFRTRTRANANWSADGPRTKSSRSTARPTCRANSRSRSVSPSDNCVDIYTHDLGFLAVVRDGEIVGYNVLVGGGMGVTPSNKATFPALAKRLAFVAPSQVFDVAEAVVKVQRDFGNRADRKLARMKYLIHNWGLEKFKAKVEEYCGTPLPAPQPDDVTGFNDHLGWDDQGDGKCFYGLNIENGRIQDNEQMQLKSALREICRSFEPGIRLTSHQSILLTDLDPAAKSEFEQILRRHRVRLSEETSTVRRWSMACVALPTCRFGDYRQRAGAARHHRPTGSRTGKIGAVPRAVHAPHDRLPERLCAAVQFRRRPGRQGRGQIHAVPGRTPGRRSAEFRIQRPGAGGGNRADPGTAVGLFPARSLGGRIVRRFLQPQGQG